MKRIAVVVGVALALALGGRAEAQQQGNAPSTPLAVSDVSGTVTLTGTPTYIHFTNDGTKDAVIRVFESCETVATITTANTKARRIKPGEGWGLGWIGGRSCGTGFGGFAHVAAAAGETTSVRWFAE